MKLIKAPQQSAERRRGAALILSFMVLLVLILIVAQIRISTDTTARVARNEEALVTMDAAIESALLQVFEDLKSDAESGGAADGAGAMAGEGGGDEFGGDGGDGAGAAGGGDSGPSDSKEDDWAKAQRTELNEVQLRILIQDEDSKYNVLSVLTEDEEEADKAFDRLARVIEWSRKGTEAEIDSGSARQMATAMLEYMQRRDDQVSPRPLLLSDDEEDSDTGLPLSLQEFAAIDPELFPSDVFRDYIDEDGKIVHSLGSFLTVWSSVGTRDEADQLAQQESGQTAATEPSGASGGQDDEPTAGEGGGGEADGAGPDASAGQDGGADVASWALNVNTAPGAVLHALIQDRDMPYRFWDEIILYRNEEDDDVEENDDPPLDEYGRQLVVRQFFSSIDELAEVDGWDLLEPIMQGELQDLLKTQSQVFSIFVTARKPTGEEQIDPFSRQQDIEREEANWQGLVRTVRAVVWRRQIGEGQYEILPIVRWEVMDYVPFEVLDFPEDRDYR